uniref:Large ribosomal subunit protein uL15m n=1 Tax=Myxobolus squamalis TaxID=59785 RepID=A0A6B2G049_MYXSQ
MADLIKVGAVSSIKDGVVLLGKGKEDFDYKIRIEVTKASLASVEAVRKNGGEITCVYMPQIMLLKYYRYFKSNHFKTVEDFIQTLSLNDAELTKRLMNKYGISTPVLFPPSRLMKIYCNSEVGGFMSYDNTLTTEFKINPKKLISLKP